MRRRLLVLPGTAAALVVAAVVLELLAAGSSYGHHLAAGSVWFEVAPALAGVVLSVALAVKRRPMVVVATTASLLWATAALLRAAVHLWVVDAVVPHGGLLAALWVLKFALLAPQIVFTLVFLQFPTGRFVPGWWGWCGRVAFTVSTLAAVVSLVVPANLNSVPISRSDPRLGGGQFFLGAGALGDALLPFAVPVTLAAVVVLMLVELPTPLARYRSSDGYEREALSWAVWSVLATAILVVANTILREGSLDGSVVTVCTAVITVALAVAVVQPALVSGEAAVAHTLVYGGLGVVVLSLDVAFLSALTFVLGDALDQRDVVLVVLLFSAVIYGPLRASLWRLVRRWLLGQRDDPYDVVAGLASGLEDADEGPAQLSAVARAVSQAFGVSFVCVEVDRGAGTRLAATIGNRPREVRTLPISYRNAEVGRLVLPARGIRTRLSHRDERLLGDLVRQAASAARTTQLADELQADRERLVLAREEERRRIRRDLHDGLGPSLGGAVFQLDSARLTVDRDAEGAEGQLRGAETTLLGVMDDVRRLVSDLRPPTLDALGLVGALRQQGDLVAGVRARVEAPGVDLTLPAAVEVAAYRIAGEALTNVARHAEATRCVVRLSLEPGSLLLEVTDDGRGIALDRQAGVGLLSLRERAEELGGRTEILCPSSGGTTVRAWLPLQPAPQPRPEEQPA